MRGFGFYFYFHAQCAFSVFYFYFRVLAEIPVGRGVDQYPHRSILTLWTNSATPEMLELMFMLLVVA